MENNKKVTSVVFLDVDGVINTRKSCVKSPAGFVGVDDARVKILAQAMNFTCMDGVVLTTTWKDLAEDAEDYVYLVSCLNKHGIQVLGKTSEAKFSQRAEGVIQFLETHSEIEEYVILDDQQFGFRDFSKLWESFIDTRARGIENAVLASETPSVSAMLFMDAIRKYS